MAHSIGDYPELNLIRKHAMQEIVRTPYLQMISGFMREPPFATVVYDGAKHHYVPADHFFFGPVVSRWIVSQGDDLR